MLKYVFSTYVAIKTAKEGYDEYRHVFIEGEFSTVLTDKVSLRITAEAKARRRCEELYPNSIVEDVLRPLVNPKI